MKKLVFLSGNRMPSGTAYSERIISLCKLFMNIGYSVHVICDYITNSDGMPGKNYYINGIEYEGLSSASFTCKRNELSNKCCIAFQNYIDNNKIDFVIFNAYSDRYDKITDILKKKRIPYCLELCEHIDVSSYKYGYLNPRYWRVEYYYLMKYTKEKAIIGISRYLCDFFNKKGVYTLRIPIITDMEFYDNNFKKNIPIVITYAGNCSKSKEELYQIIEALKIINQQSIKIVLNIYGPTYLLLKRNLGRRYKLIDECNEFVHVYEQVSHSECINAIKNSDFTFFLRPERISSQAGFPTKMTESFSYGTPVITNDTGDICLYLKNKINGFIVNKNTTDSVLKLLNFILELSYDDYLIMRKNARATIDNELNINIYNEKLRMFIENTKKLF